jgi:hypothetical protein
VTGVPAIDAIALDYNNHRVFAASRNPPLLTILGAESGKQITQLEGVPGICDLWYDSVHKRI